MVVLKQFPEGYRYKTSSQPVSWLIFVIQGELLVSSPRQWLRLGPGFVGVLPQGFSFTIDCTKSFLGLYFSIEESPPLTLLESQMFAAEGDVSIKVMAELVRQELQKPEQSADVTKSFCQSMTQLVTRIITSNHSNDEKRNPEILVQKAIQKMKSQLYLSNSVEKIVTGLGVSYRQMSRYFEKITGQKPKQIFMKLKLQEACKILQETNFSILYIAQELGFSSGQHLSMQFKKEIGHTPKEWRKIFKTQQQTDSIYS